MTDTDRIIEAVCDECVGAHRHLMMDEPHQDTPLTTATVNTALLGVCPECHEAERNQGFDRNGSHAAGEYVEYPCPNPYHDHREEMMRHGE